MALQSIGLRCLVLGYDKTDAARLASSWAARALSPSGKLVIVHCTRPLHGPGSVLMSAAERRRLAAAVIEELLLDGDDSLLDLELEGEISDQDPASALIDAARRHRASAIVIGSKPHSRLQAALGTITSTVIKALPSPS
jgi:nucleotide-binding universal stress UspA family protein